MTMDQQQQQQQHLYSSSSRIEAGPSSPQSPKRRATKTANGDNKVSCTACRTVKCKCVESSDPHSTICQRCTRLSLQCVYQAHQRGRRRKDDILGHPLALRNERDESTQSQTHLHGQLHHPHHPHRHPSRQASSDRSSPTVAPLRPPKRKRSGLSTEPSGSARQVSFDVVGQSLLGHENGEDGPSRSPSRSLDDGSDNAQSARHRPDLDRPPANSVYHDVADRRIFSIAGALERNGTGEDGDGETTPAAAAAASSDDPVSLGILSMDECDSLFEHYFDQLQTCVCLLDPALHTASYTRSTSLQLFTAVLAVAAKFFRPEMYEGLLGIANHLVNRAVADCACQIEIVQAICILHYWKKPTDGRGWLRLGHAIRLGYQLDLHLPRKRKLPTSEREARIVIDRERTWISLYCFDSTMTQLSDRPSMMHKTPGVASWIQGIVPYALPSDGQLDFAVKTSLLSSEVRQLQSCKGSYEVLRSGLRRVLEDLHRSHQVLSSDEATVKLTSTTSSINKFSTLAVQLLVECTSLSLAPHKHRISLLHACVSTSLDLLDVVVEDFARKAIMPMIEDAHSVAVASTAVRLLRFMAYLDSAAKASVMRRLTRVVIVCREAARGDQESHPAYLARFIHALLDKAHQSRQPSRESSPNRQVLKMTPVVNPGDPSPLQHKTTPDQWWEEIGQFAYHQEPVQPGMTDFWEGFPLLAGAMNTLSPLIQPAGARVLPGTDAGGAGAVDPLDSASAATFPAGLPLPWDAVWDAGFLGISQDPPMN